MNEIRKFSISTDEAERNLQRTFAKRQEQRGRKPKLKYPPQKVVKTGHEAVLQKILDSENKLIEFYAVNICETGFVRAQLVDYDKYSITIQTFKGDIVCIFKHDIGFFKFGNMNSSAVNFDNVSFGI